MFGVKVFGDENLEATFTIKGFFVVFRFKNKFRRSRMSLRLDGFLFPNTEKYLNI